MIETDAVAIKLNEILIKQNEMLTVILAEQRLIREAVTNRDWERLDAAIHRIQVLSDEFTSLESERLTTVFNFIGNETLDVYQIAHLFSYDLRQTVLENFRMMRQKLAVSKIENDTISEYIRITKDFLQSVFDNAVPQARNTVYSAKGNIVKTMPESIILDQLM